MEKTVTEITICMGSSCFSRGNKKTLQLIQQYLNERGIQDKVLFKGSHCLGKCEQGPVLRIGETEHLHLSSAQLTSLLDDHFADQTGRE